MHLPCVFKGKGSCVTSSVYAKYTERALLWCRCDQGRHVPDAHAAGWRALAADHPGRRQRTPQGAPGVPPSRVRTPLF